MPALTIKKQIQFYKLAIHVAVQYKYMMFNVGRNPMAINRAKNQVGYILVAHSHDFGDCYLQVCEESYRLSSRLTAATIFNSYTELKDYIKDHGTDVEVASKCKLQPWRIQINPV